MQNPIPVEPGASIDTIDTPALILDLDELETALAARSSDTAHRVAVWPHKTPAIARRQLEVPGARGIAVRSVREASVFAAAGIEDIRVLRPVVGAANEAALAQLQGATTEDDGLPIEGLDDLARAVTMTTRVSSVPEPGRAILDCGQKAIGRDLGDPTLVSNADIRVIAGSAEHGIALTRNVPPFSIGDWLQLVPADIATTFTLHDWLNVVRGGRFVERWAIEARGAF